MFEKYVFPRLEKWRVSQVFQLKLKLTGITESQLEEKIKDLYPPPSLCRITTLAYPGQIEIHLSAYSSCSQEEAREKVMSVEVFLPRENHWKKWSAFFFGSATKH